MTELDGSEASDLKLDERVNEAVSWNNSRATMADQRARLMSDVKATKLQSSALFSRTVDCIVYQQSKKLHERKAHVKRCLTDNFFRFTLSGGIISNAAEQ